MPPRLPQSAVHTVETHQAQLTPAQVLETGLRAEAEGRFDFASQFFRHLTDYYPQTREAAAAHDGLVRIADGASTGSPARRRALELSPAEGRRDEPAFDPPPARHDYRAGRVVARLVTWLGGATACLGLAAAPVMLWGPRALLDGGALAQALPEAIGVGSAFRWLGAVGVGGAMVVAGLLLVAFGQLVRAILDQANASRDLAAMARARADHDLVKPHATPHDR